MILIVTHKEDYTSDFVIDKLNEKGIAYHRFNCEDCLLEDIQIRLDNDIFIASVDGNEDFDSVWYRRTKLPNLSARNEGEFSYLIKEVDAFMRNLFGVIQSKWLSDPFAIEQAENKFRQLRLAREVGFLVPKTHITTRKESLREFLGSNIKSIIKPISGGRIYYARDNAKLIFTNIIPENIIHSLDEFDITPAIFQEYIEKEYELRVTIVGNEVFSARVDSQSEGDTTVDWRRKKIKFSPYNLPENIKIKCLLMMDKLGIKFGAFDLIKSASGQYYFLELNPNGQWVWIEKDTGLPISDSIIKYLT